MFGLADLELVDGGAVLAGLLHGLVRLDQLIMVQQLHTQHGKKMTIFYILFIQEQCSFTEMIAFYSLICIILRRERMWRTYSILIKIEKRDVGRRYPNLI